MERDETQTDASGMTSMHGSGGLLARIVTTPRLRPILTAMAAIVLVAAGSLPATVAAAPGATTAATSGPKLAQIVDRSASDRVTTRSAAPSVNVATPTIASPAPVAKAVVKPASKPKADPVTKAIIKPAPPKIAPVPNDPPIYKGTNHVWIPALGISKSVSGFSCTRSKAPDDLTYRWGCAGTNNVYLLGHAYGVFKPLHDAYYNGKLKKGLKVVYADSTGTVHTYSVLWWKVVKPTTDAAWAWAPLASPGMTLQTCLGANSEYRLMIRLDQVD